MLKISRQDSSLKIFCNEKLLFNHSEKYPAFHIGSGRGRYKFVYGLFKIKDRLKSKQSLKQIDVEEESENRIVLNLAGYMKMELLWNDGVLCLKYHHGEKEFNRFWMTLAADENEHIYGCGEQFTHLDLRGRKVPIWVQEPGLGRGKDLITLLTNLKTGYGGKWYTTYFSQPTFVSSSHWFFHNEGTAYCTFDFRQKNQYVLEFWQKPETMYIGTEKNTVETLGSLSRLLGRQPLPPDWATDGMWLGLQGGKDVTERKIAIALEKGVKVSAIWCQDWEGIRITSFGKQLFWNWKASEDLYGNLKEYITDLKSRGIRYIGYINPFLALEGDLYKEAKEKNYCIKNAEGSDYYVTITTFPTAMIDLSNPESRIWIKGVIKKNMIGIGMAGWMADFGEYVPADAILHSGENPEVYHNRYATEWAKINCEAIGEAGKTEEVTFFMRAGYTGSSRYSAMNWNGDQLVNWSKDNGFPTIIPGSLSMGFTGVGMVHSDIGGYTTIRWIKRSKELFMRWVEVSAFSPFMRTHEGNRPDSNWQFDSDDETLIHLARMTQVYAKLKPYNEHLFSEYRNKGLPPMRHPFIHYEKDLYLHQIKYQYMYGRELLVAPVMKKGKKIQDVYLPQDNWIHFWTGEKYIHGWHHIEAPTGQPPVFYRKGSAFEKLFKEASEC